MPMFKAMAGQAAPGFRFAAGRPWPAVALCTVLAGGLLLPAAGTLAQDGHSRPDFTGIWFPNGFARRTPTELPWTDAAAPIAEEYEAEFALSDDPGKYCIWPGMPRAVWGAPFPIEIFHRDHDLTIYWEGYGMYRKIYMADHNPPEPVLPTAMGHSLAHWEGDVLVIETTHLKPYPYMNELATTSDAKVTERMYIEERQADDGTVERFLVDDIVLTDPKLYREPIRLHAEARYRPDLSILEYTCTDTIWEEHLEERGLTLPDIDALPDPTTD